LKAGAWVNGRVGENPPIQEAASRGPNTRLIRLLIDSGADVNAKDRDGKTLVQTLGKAVVWTASGRRSMN